MKYRSINLSTLNVHKSLRLKPEFFDFILYDWPSLTERWNFNLRLKDCVKSIRNGKDVKKEDYSFDNTGYFYITVNNIRPYEFSYQYEIYLDYEIGEILDKYKLNENDVIITRSGSVGVAKLFDIIDENRIFIPSGYLVIISVNEKVISPKWLEYYLSSSIIKNYFEIFSSGKTQKNLSQYDILNLPIPKLDTDRFDEFSKNVAILESEINNLKEKAIPLQIIIDEELTKYGLKSTSLKNYRTEILTSSLIDITQNKAIRIGAEYNDFWLSHNGFLFEGTNKEIDIVKIGEIVKLSQKKKMKKGLLDEPKILIDFDKVESPNGRIIDYENTVIELGSEKIEFDNCDFLTNKLRPYLGYTILNNSELNLIGTTEFIPFNVLDKSNVLDEYIRYLLLSNEYLEKSKFLMSGKEHPRISEIDILKIKIPLPSFEVQQKIVYEISKKEIKLQRILEKIIKLRENIDDLILNELCTLEKCA